MSRIEYKNSGIFWQPFIPKSWHVTRLKYILKKLSREKVLMMNCWYALIVGILKSEVIQG